MHRRRDRTLKHFVDDVLPSVSTGFPDESWPDAEVRRGLHDGGH